MKSDSLVTILLSILAVTLGIINAKKKKKQALTRPRQLFFDTVDTGNEEVRQEQVLDTVPEPEPVTEPKPMELLSVQETHHSRGKEKLKEMGFDAKKALLFSEILKPKF